MKKLFVIAMLATVGMAACSKDDTAPAAGPKKYVQVTIPEDMVSGETRTSIDGTTTNWVAGDKVAVLLYDGAATMTCQFTADKSGPTTTFSGDVAGNLVTVDEVNMDYGGYRMKVKKGGSIGDFYVTGLKTDDQGRIYVDPNTNTVTTDPNTWLYGGNTEARFRLGWNNRFSYKGVNLGVLFDARIGGQGVSATQALMDRWGASQDSADARENGGVWISEDQKVPDARVFYANNGNGLSMLSHYVYSMTNVRLRELTLGYDLPSRWFNDKIGMTVSLVGRNLWMLYNKAPFDPEITASTGTYYQGLDYFMQPSARTIGFSVRLQF